MTGNTFVLPIALEVRLHREEAVPHGWEDAFDPEEPRDPHGQWTSGGGTESGNKTFAEADHDEVVKAVKEAAVAQGYDPYSVSVTTVGRQFELNGKQYNYAGAAYHDTGKIVIFDTQENNLSPGTIPGLMAHEIMHQKFHAYMDDFREEQNKVMEFSRSVPNRSGPGGVDQFMKADGTLREPYDKQFPLYQEYVKLVDLNYAKLQKEDGCSPYSTEWWTAVKTFGSGLGPDVAYHETLAEMARLHLQVATEEARHRAFVAEHLARGGEWSEKDEATWKSNTRGTIAPPTLMEGGFLSTKPSKTWLAFYNAVNRHWEKVK
jgi:hypothetical protein